MARRRNRSRATHHRAPGLRCGTRPLRSPLGGTPRSGQRPSGWRNAPMRRRVRRPVERWLARAALRTAAAKRRDRLWGDPTRLRCHACRGAYSCPLGGAGPVGHPRVVQRRSGSNVEAVLEDRPADKNRGTREVEPGGAGRFDRGTAKSPAAHGTPIPTLAGVNPPTPVALEVPLQTVSRSRRSVEDPIPASALGRAGAFDRPSQKPDCAIVFLPLRPINVPRLRVASATRADLRPSSP